jgi:nitroreductase
MDFYEVIEKRRSVRKYAGTAVPEAKLQRIMDAVNWAPTACNLQPFRFLVLRSPERKQPVCECYSQPFLAQAPLLVVALGNREQAWKRLDGSSAHVIDVSIAMEHLVLAAAAEGLGTCWICAYDQQKMHRNLRLDPEWDVVAITPLGYPSPDCAEPKRRRKDVGEIFEVE